MRKFNVKNWKESIQVAVFTIKQQLKTRSFQFAFAIFLCIALFGPFVAGFLQGGKESEKPQTTTIESLYVVEKLESGLELEYETLSELPFYKNLKIVRVESGQENRIAKIKDDLEHINRNDILLDVCEEEQFSIKIYKPRKSTLWEKEGENLLEEVELLLDRALKKYTNLSPKQQKVLDMTMDTKIQVLSRDGSKKDLEKEDGIAYGEYMCIYGFIFVLLMIGVYAGSVIASTVVSEKNGKVLEYLLTAVSPFSLLFGKIIGVFLLVIGEIICIGCVTKISDCLAADMQGMKKSVLSGVIPDAILERFSLSNVLLALIFIILNLVFFGFLAAFAGTRASRVEELKDTIMIFSIGELVGGYLAMFSAVYMMEETKGVFLYFAYIFPLSSSFLLPGAIFTGRIDQRIIAVAILLLLICVNILIAVTVKSYQKHLFLSGSKRKKKRGVENWGA